MASIKPCRAVGSTSGLDALVDTILAASQKLTSLSARPKGKRAPEGPQQETPVINGYQSRSREVAQQTLVASLPNASLASAQVSRGM